MIDSAQPNDVSNADLPRVIAVSSGKGGVGKSSIVVNLAISLAKAGARVCLLDADTGLANTNILLGIAPEYNLEHVLYGSKLIDEVIVDGPHGIKIIPGANGISHCVTLHSRQQLRLTRELARIERDFDYLLIDTAAGITQNTLDFISAAHHTLVIITPEPTSLTDAFSMIKLLKSQQSKVEYHVVVNMCASANQAKEVFNRFSSAVEKYIGVQANFLGIVPRDESMRAAVVLQNPVAMFPDDDPSSRCFITLAEKLDAATANSDVSRSFSDYWQQQFADNNKGTLVKTADLKSLDEQDASEQQTVATRDGDYICELRSRLLLLIERGHADRALVEALLQEAVSAYMARFEQPPLDIMNQLEQHIASPERDDLYLRELAELLKPWVGSNDLLPTDELSLKSMGYEAGLEQSATEALPVFNPALEILEKDGQGQVETEELQSIEPSSSEVVSAFYNEDNLQVDGVQRTQSEQSAQPTMNSRTHHYDTARFGSQEYLLDVLLNHTDTETPINKLLDSL